MYKKFVCALAAATIASAAYAQQFVAKKGSEAYYLVNTGVKSAGYNVNNSATWHFKVNAVTDSTVQLTCTLLRATYSYGTNLLFDTGDSLKCVPVSSSGIEWLSMLNKPFAYTFRRTPGEQPGLLKLHEESIKAWNIKPQTAELMKSNTKGMMVLEMNQLFPQLPSSLDKLPDSWLSPDSTLLYHKTGNFGYTTEQAKSTPGFKQEHSGQSQFSTATGMLASGGFKSAVTKNGDSKPEMEQSAEVIQLSAAQVKRLPLSNEFLAAVVTASGFSTALGNDITPEFDSTKVRAYLAKNEPLFGRYNFFKMLKLDLLQRSNLKNKWEAYGDQLLQVPDSLIADSRIHLFNKAQQVINVSADSAYNTLKYLSKHPEGFRSWVQESYSQNFLPERMPLSEIKKAWIKDGMPTDEADKLEAKYARGRIINRQLIEKLGADRDSAIYNEVHPMYLWVKANRYANNKDSLIKIAAELEQMSDNDKLSNNHRYALIVYKQLMAQGGTKEADNLLNKHMSAMEKVVLDTTNTSEAKAAIQNMLAYGYKLKSDVAAQTNPKASMEYLAKAAAFSPKNNKEKAYTSFYDRVFLNSKESYRPEFAEALIKQGNSQEAMKIFSQQLNTDPAIFGDLQASFSKNFPDLDFYDFFTNVVTKSWKTAPAFALQSPDTKTTYKLEDYRGKWLLLDFWGTWCPPCREEMPKINAFAQKIKDRKDISFLSIACRDNADAVTKYLAMNNFSIPASMSNNKIEKDYAVPGYPSKFLISPTGAVLPIAFGQDWEKAVDDFTGLQPKKKDDAKLQQSKD